MDLDWMVYRGMGDTCSGKFKLHRESFVGGLGLYSSRDSTSPPMHYRKLVYRKNGQNYIDADYYYNFQTETYLILFYFHDLRNNPEGQLSLSIILGRSSKMGDSIYHTYGTTEQTIHGNNYSLSQIDSVMQEWFLTSEQLEKMYAATTSMLSKRNFRIKEMKTYPSSPHPILYSVNDLLSISPWLAIYGSPEDPDGLATSSIRVNQNNGNGGQFNYISLSQVDSVLRSWNIDYKKD